MLLGLILSIATACVTNTSDYCLVYSPITGYGDNLPGDLERQIVDANIAYDVLCN